MTPFLNIFSNKKIKTKVQKPKQKIIIDYREKNCLIASELIKQGFIIEFKELKVADYIVKGVAIERKTTSDFISSMINRRLLKQLEEMQQYSNRLLIVEGLEEQELYSDNNLTGINPNAVRGFLLSIVLKFRIPIIFTKNYLDTAKFISVLANKKTKSETPLNISKKNLSKKQRLQFILESFQGIGPKTAQKLLKEFKTLKAIINASLEELQNILGKKADSLYELIHLEY
jgi:ERCC4-type nuclease